MSGVSLWAKWSTERFQEEIRDRSIDDDSILIERVGWTLGPCWRWKSQRGAFASDRAHRTSFRVFHLNGEVIPAGANLCVIDVITDPVTNFFVSILSTCFWELPKTILKTHHEKGASWATFK